MLLERWRGRCAHLLVDEAQDLDRAQLRMALLLAAPANRVFFVGDDDQSIYGWRLADVRRVLSLDASLPGLRRVDLEVNYRCPPTVVARAVRLVEHNRERFAKVIRAGPAASGPIVLAPDSSDETVRIGRVFDNWPSDDASTGDPRPDQPRAPAGDLGRARPTDPVSAAGDRAPRLVTARRRRPRRGRRSTDSGLPVLARLEAVRARWSARRR